jgi:hypothetical protein
MVDKDLTSKELKKIAKFLDKKVKPIAIKHGKKIGGAALTAIKQTASTFGPGKKVKVAYKAGQAVGAGVKIIKEAKQKGSVARNVYAGTIKKVKKAVRSDTGKKVTKVAKKSLKVFQGTIMVGGMAPLVPISLGIMGAKAGTKLAIKHGGKVVKSLKAKLKNIWSNPK